MPTMYYDMKKPVEKQQRIKGTISNFMRTDIHKCDTCRRAHCARGFGQRFTEESDTQAETSGVLRN